MVEALSNLDEISRKRVEAIAQELASYGLGIFAPHAHDDDGKIVPLSMDTTSYEKDLTVQFVSTDKIPSNAIAVGWRWENGTINVCAHCCSDH